MGESWDVDGIAARGRVGSVGPALAMIAFALVFALGVSMFSLGGMKWELVGLILAFGGTVICAWLLLYRRFLDASLVMLTLALPLHIDVELWATQGWSYVIGWPAPWILKLSDIFLAISLSAWFFDRVTQRGRPTEKLGWVGIWLAVFLAGGLLFPFHSAEPMSSLVDWTQFFTFAAVFFVLAKRIEDRDLLKWIVLGIAAQVWLQAVISIAQYATGSSLGLDFLGERRGVKTFFTEAGAEARAGGLLGHPNNLALFLVLVGPLVLVKFLTVRDLLARFGWGLTYCVLNVALLLTFSRFGWLCQVASFFAVYYLVRARAGQPLWLSLGLPLATSVVVFVVLFVGFESFRARLLEDDRGSTESRFEQFKTAAAIVSHWPIVGTGIGSYATGAIRFLSAQGRTGPFLFLRVHNGSILVFAELGIFGFIGYHGWYFATLARGWRAWRYADDELAAIGTGVFIGLCAWFAKSMYNAHTPIVDSSVWLFMALMVVVAKFGARDDEVEEEEIEEEFFVIEEPRT